MSSECSSTDSENNLIPVEKPTKQILAGDVFVHVDCDDYPRAANVTIAVDEDTKGSTQLVGRALLPSIGGTLCECPRLWPLDTIRVLPIDFYEDAKAHNSYSVDALCCRRYLLQAGLFPAAYIMGILHLIDKPFWRYLIACHGAEADASGRLLLRPFSSPSVAARKLRLQAHRENLKLRPFLQANSEEGHGTNSYCPSNRCVFFRDEDMSVAGCTRLWLAYDLKEPISWEAESVSLICCLADLFSFYLLSAEPVTNEFNQWAYSLALARHVAQRCELRLLHTAIGKRHGQIAVSDIPPLTGKALAALGGLWRVHPLLSLQLLRRVIHLLSWPQQPCSNPNEEIKRFYKQRMPITLSKRIHPASHEQHGQTTETDRLFISMSSDAVSEAAALSAPTRLRQSPREPLPLESTTMNMAVDYLHKIFKRSKPEEPEIIFTNEDEKDGFTGFLSQETARLKQIHIKKRREDKPTQSRDSAQLKSRLEVRRTLLALRKAVKVCRAKVVFPLRAILTFLQATCRITDGAVSKHGRRKRLLYLVSPKYAELDSVTTVGCRHGQAWQDVADIVHEHHARLLAENPSSSSDQLLRLFLHLKVNLQHFQTLQLPESVVVKFPSSNLELEENEEMESELSWRRAFNKMQLTLRDFSEASDCLVDRQAALVEARAALHSRSQKSQSRDIVLPLTERHELRVAPVITEDRTPAPPQFPLPTRHPYQTSEQDRRGSAWPTPVYPEPTATKNRGNDEEPGTQRFIRVGGKFVSLETGKQMDELALDEESQKEAMPPPAWPGHNVKPEHTSELAVMRDPHHRLWTRFRSQPGAILRHLRWRMLTGGEARGFLLMRGEERFPAKADFRFLQRFSRRDLMIRHKGSWRTRGKPQIIPLDLQPFLMEQSAKIQLANARCLHPAVALEIRRHSLLHLRWPLRPGETPTKPQSDWMVLGPPPSGVAPQRVSQPTPSTRWEPQWMRRLSERLHHVDLPPTLRHCSLPGFMPTNRIHRGGRTRRIRVRRRVHSRASAMPPPAALVGSLGRTRPKPPFASNIPRESLDTPRKDFALYGGTVIRVPRPWHKLPLEPHGVDGVDKPPTVMPAPAARLGKRRVLDSSWMAVAMRYMETLQNQLARWTFLLPARSREKLLRVIEDTVERILSGTPSPLERRLLRYAQTELISVFPTVGGEWYHLQRRTSQLIGHGAITKENEREVYSNLLSQVKPTVNLTKPLDGPFLIRNPPYYRHFATLPALDADATWRLSEDRSGDVFEVIGLPLQRKYSSYVRRVTSIIRWQLPHQFGCLALCHGKRCEPLALHPPPDVEEEYWNMVHYGGGDVHQARVECESLLNDKSLRGTVIQETPETDSEGENVLGQAYRRPPRKMQVILGGMGAPKQELGLRRASDFPLTIIAGDHPALHRWVLGGHYLRNLILGADEAFLDQERFWRSLECPEGWVDAWLSQNMDLESLLEYRWKKGEMYWRPVIHSPFMAESSMPAALLRATIWRTLHHILSWQRMSLLRVVLFDVVPLSRCQDLCTVFPFCDAEFNDELRQLLRVHRILAGKPLRIFIAENKRVEVPFPFWGVCKTAKLHSLDVRLFPRVYDVAVALAETSLMRTWAARDGAPPARCVLKRWMWGLVMRAGAKIALPLVQQELEKAPTPKDEKTGLKAESAKQQLQEQLKCALKSVVAGIPPFREKWVVMPRNL